MLQKKKANLASDLKMHRGHEMNTYDDNMLIKDSQEAARSVTATRQEAGTANVLIKKVNPTVVSEILVKSLKSRPKNGTNADI